MITEAGRELDALVAEKVMGLPDVGRYSREDMRSLEWTHYGKNGDVHDFYYLLDEDNNPRWSVPRYSTSIAAAWEVVEKLTGDDGDFSFKLHNYDCDWEATYLNGPRSIQIKSIAATAPLAICLAALKAVGHVD